jgi:hypothetical protein
MIIEITGIASKVMSGVQVFELGMLVTTVDCF